MQLKRKNLEQSLPFNFFFLKKNNRMKWIPNYAAVK